MTHRRTRTVLGSLLIGLIVTVNAPIVRADAPCITDGQGECVPPQGDGFTTQQISAFDLLTTTAALAATLPDRAVADTNSRAR